MYKRQLLELRKKYVVYLLSNTNEIHWQWSCLHAFRYKAFRAEDFFEHIYLSYEMKMAKPDADKMCIRDSVNAFTVHRCHNGC